MSKTREYKLNNNCKIVAHDIPTVVPPTNNDRYEGYMRGSFKCDNFRYWLVELVTPARVYYFHSATPFPIQPEV